MALMIQMALKNKSKAECQDLIEENLNFFQKRIRGGAQESLLTYELDDGELRGLKNQVNFLKQENITLSEKYDKEHSLLITTYKEFEIVKAK